MATALGALALTSCSTSHGARVSSPAPTVARTRGPTTTAAPKHEVQRTLVVRRASWTLPAPLDREAAVTLGGDVVVMGGNRDGGPTRIIDAIDPRTGAARRLGLLASAAHDAAGAVLGGRPALLGGGAGTALDAVQVLRADGTSEVAGHLPHPRADVASAASAQGVTYVAGGYDGTSVVLDVLSTVNGSSFQTVAPLAVGVRYPAVVVSGSTLYVIGGATSGGENAGTDTNVVQAVSLPNGPVRVVAHLPATLSHAAVAQLGGRIYVLGGHVNGVWSDQVAQFDPATATLRVVAHLPRAVSDAAATTVGGSAYLLGGETAPNAPIADVVELTLSQ